jgi:hypothetical protein
MVWNRNRYGNCVDFVNVFLVGNYVDLMAPLSQGLSKPVRLCGNAAF